MYFDDKDYSQKVRLQKILWNMGYWSRIEIPIVIYEDDTQSKAIQKHYLTDIDVYGELLQLDFSSEKSIGDCKSGKNVKIFERLFWVKGVKEYLQAEKAYLVKSSISAKAKIFLPKVGIIGVDSNSLIELEKIYHTSSLKDLFNNDYYKMRVDSINQLENEFKKIFDYLNTRYWFTDLNVSMNVLMNMLKKNNFYLEFDKNNKSHRFLLMEICIMLSRAIMDCCRYTISRDLINTDRSVLEYIHGGIDGFNNKLQMVRQISQYLHDFLNDKDISESVLVKPDYYDDLLKIIIIMIGEAYNAKDITRYLEIMQHEILLDKKLDYGDISGLSYSPVGHKLAKDIVSFYLKKNNLDTHFFEDIMDR